MSELCLLSAVELTELIQTGKIKSEDLAKSYIERYDKFEKNVKAWAHYDKNFYEKNQ